MDAEENSYVFGKVVDLYTYISKSNLGEITKAGVLFIVNILNTYLLLRTQFVIQYTEDFRDGIDVDLKEKIRFLKEKRIIDQLIIHSHIFSDEPFQFSATAVPSGYGHDFFDQQKTIRKSLSEAVERYLWENTTAPYKNRQIFSSYNELKYKKLDIFSLQGFTQDQKKSTIKLQFTSETIFSWLPGFSLTGNKTLYCPTSLVSLNYFRSSDEPMLRWNITTGQATRPSLAEAKLQAILEIIERDAFMISYLNKLTPKKISISHYSDLDKDIASIYDDCMRYNLELHLLALPTDFPVHCIIAVIIDRSGLGPALTVGASCSFDIENCIKHATSEALSVRFYLKDKFQKEHCGKNFDRLERLIYWSKPENIDKLNFFLEGTDTIQVPLLESKFNIEEKLCILISAFRSKKYELCCIDMSDKELKNAGFESVSIISPEMQPLHLNEEIPYFGGKRLKEVPLMFGYDAASIINTIPHPFP